MITVVRKSDDLNQEVWDFSILTNLSDEIRIKLFNYEKQERKTKRHKFRTIPGQWYDRFKSSKTYTPANYTIALENVPLPPDVLEEAKQKLISNITFDL